MPQFIGQVLPQFPSNANLTPQLALLGNTIRAKQQQAMQQRKLLADQAFQQQQFGLAQDRLGLAEKQFGQQAAHQDRMFGLEQDKLAMAREAAERALMEQQILMRLAGAGGTQPGAAENPYYSVPEAQTGGFGMTAPQQPMAQNDALMRYLTIKNPAAANALLKQRESDPAFIANRATTKKQAEGQVKQRLDEVELQKGGQQVMGAINQLRSKVGSTSKFATDEQKQQAERFEDATGPIEGAEGYFGFNPIRTTKALFGAESIKDLKLIKQDAQAINTLMQRALLKGGGSITENEREQINQILGGIQTATSASEAEALLNNFEGLVRKIFRMDNTTDNTTKRINFNDLPE